MSDLLVLSELIAREAHAGQLYDARDYVDAHVSQVALTIAKMDYGEEYQATGWLHDVIEDSDITADDLLDKGIPIGVIKAVELLSKTGDDHETYLGKIATNKLSVVGKFADSSVNFANTIIGASGIDDERFNRWYRQYARNLAFLLPILPPTN